MGLMNLVRKYVPRFFEKAKVLNRLLRKGKIDWIEEAEEAFQEMERLLTSKPLLLDLPVDGVEFVLDCDASGEAVGGMLLQYLPNGEVRVIGYASTVFTGSEREMAFLAERSLCSGLLYPIFCGLPLGSEVRGEVRQLESIMDMDINEQSEPIWEIARACRYNFTLASATCTN